MKVMCFFHPSVFMKGKIEAKPKGLAHGFFLLGMLTTKECNGDAGSSSDPRRQQCFGGKVGSLEVPPEFIYLLDSSAK
ncbi:unnamed protein product [Prunus armeniaca]|uniref:Uncharacterized protein n=1 Tax=Prunus armeniaca TaxID=36596 RepID=A0A6J5VAH8_PRUAR|nr:unnamed protein product [Prunus armeniaca]